MQLSEIRINLCGPPTPQYTPPQPTHPRISQPLSTSTPCSAESTRGGRLRAFCSLTFDRTFVVRDVKLIEGNDGLFLAMPSRKLCDRCRRCSEKNHLRAKFCNQCGSRLDENRNMARPNGNSRNFMRPKLHADIAHPINAACRLELERQVLMAYMAEMERSRLPGYIAPNLDGEDSDFDEVMHVEPQTAPLPIHLRRTGTE